MAKKLNQRKNSLLYIETRKTDKLHGKQLKTHQGEDKMTVPKKFSHLAVLLGFKRSIQNDYLTVWCPHCAQWHNHGTEAGHVVAHCKDERSPYRETGYYIKKISNKEMDRLIEKYEGEEING